MISRKFMTLLFLTLCTILAGNTACVTAADVTCLDTLGEARIVNGDVPSARMEAIARARWNAVVKALGIQIRTQTLVQNMRLVDDVIIKKVGGFISKHTVLSEETDVETIKVKINACVEPEKAAEAVTVLGRNHSVSVLIPVRRPRVNDEGETTTSSKSDRTRKSSTRTIDEQEESNIFSENLIGRLTETGYTVTDIAPATMVDAEVVDRVMRSGNFITLRSVLYKNLSNVLLVGKVDYTVSDRRGDDIGYGADNPFNRVTVRLTYRLISRSPETGQMVILGAGTAENHGMATNVEDAASKGLQALADKTIPVLMEKLEKFIKGVTKKIRIKIVGSGDSERTLDIKQMLSEISWVTDIEAVGLNEYTLNYPENTLYLANSLARDRRLKVAEFAPDRITLEYLDDKH